MPTFEDMDVMIEASGVASDALTVASVTDRVDTQLPGMYASC